MGEIYSDPRFSSTNNLKSLRKAAATRILRDFPEIPFGYKWYLEEADLQDTFFVSLLNPMGEKIAMYADPDFLSEEFIASVKETIEKDQPISDANFLSE